MGIRIDGLTEKERMLQAEKEIETPTVLFMRALTAPRAAVWIEDCAVSQSIPPSSSSRQFNPSYCNIVGIHSTV